VSNRSEQRVREEPFVPVPRAELSFVLIAWGLGTLLTLAGWLIVGSAPPIPLIALLATAFFFNLFLAWLHWRGAPNRLVTLGTRLGNIVLLTAGVHVTGGFRSPFFVLYAVYLIVAGLNDGWPGALRSYLLCLVSWAALALLQTPTGLDGWIWVGMSVGAFALIAFAVGNLADRHIRFWRESRQRSREMAFLREAGRSLTASLDPQEVLAVTLARVNELLEVEAASLALVDETTGRITFELAIGGASERIKGLRLEPGQGIVGHVIREARPLLVPDVSVDPRWYSDADSITGYQTHSIICVPLQVKTEVIGALEVLNKRGGPFTEYDQRLLSSLADLAAQAIENARLHNQLQQNARQLKDAYKEAQKLDELKSSFIRSVTHELRTPLTLIEGHLELLVDGQMGPLKPEQTESVSLVLEESEKLSRMINDIISLHNLEAIGYELEALSLVPLALAAVDRLRPKAEKASIRFQLDLPDADELPVVRGDAQRLQRVFDHLLDNAVKFSPNGGTVQLSITHERGMVFVRVKDDGIGLQFDQLEPIFDLFYQVDGRSTRRYGGTGLGLAQVKEVVEVHGGSVWAESEGPSRGSTFVVFLPVSRKEVED
jgi:signal transduction histidine kinase